MSTGQTARNAPLVAAVILLALICAAGGYLLYSGWVPPQTVSEAASSSVPETETTAPLTTAPAAATKPAQTTETTSAPDPNEPYLTYLQKELLPESGRADTSAALPCREQSGIAGIFFADLRDTGSDDMVVIRLDYTDDSCAALPVLLWYGNDSGSITLLDTFEVKPQWSAYCIRRDDKSLYLSGEYLGESADADTWRFTEIELAFRPDPDLTMLNMVQGMLTDRPAPLYPDDAELLLEMQLDTVQPVSPVTERRYLLRSYGQPLPESE